MAANAPEKEEILKRLGKHKTGKGCTYIKKLSDVDIEVFKDFITASVNHMKINTN